MPHHVHSKRSGLIVLLAILLLLLPGQDRPGRAAAEAEMQQGQHKARNADFHAAIRHFERAAIAYRLFKDPMGETTALIRAGETARTMGEIGKAHEYLLRAEGIGPESSLSPQIRGELFHLRSNLLSDEGDYPRAIREMKMAVRYKRLGGPSQDSSISLSINNIGYNFYFLNQYDSALHYYQEAVKVLDPAAHPASLDLAMYYQNIGIVHAIQGRLDTALNYMERSAGIRESGLPDDDPDLAYTYTNLGRLYRMLGDDPKAFEYNTRAEQVYIKHFGTEYPGLGTLYLNTGNNLKVMGDYDRAVSYYRKSLHIYTLGGNLSHPNIAKIYNNLGAVYLLMDQDSLAEDHLSRSLSLGTEESLQTITFRNLARIRQRKGDYASALAYLQRAGQTLSSTEGDLRAETANLSLDYGLLYKDMGLTDSALARTEEAIRILISYYGQHHPDLSEAYQAKAALLEMNGQPEQALLLYHDALRALVPGFNATDPLMNPVYSEGIITIEVLDPILGKAEALTALAGRDPRGPHLRHALDMLLQASELADAIRNQLAENSKQLLTRTLRSLYEKGLYLTCLLHQRERDPSLLEHAFLFTEKSKYAVLLSSMRDVEAREFGGIPDSLRDGERMTRDRITAYQKLINEENMGGNPDGERIARWENTIFELKREQAELIERFEQEYPKYYQFKYSQEVMTLPDLQQALHPDEVVVEYFLGEHALYALFVSPYSVIPLRRELPHHFESDIRLLRESLAPGALAQLNHAGFNEQQAAAHRMYTLLLAPVENFLRDRHLIIIPDELLGYLSFDLLLTRPADTGTMDYRNLPYLLRDHDISYSYLATLTYGAREEKSRRRMQVLGFAPDYSHLSGLPEVKLGNLRGMEKALPPIEHARSEMEMVERITGARIFNGSGASESRFKAEADQADIIHLAMHTLVDDHDPMFSKLAFTLPSEDQEDGLLNTYEIYNMDFRARMVVLSACNTGIGQLLRGEGIISLARAFKYAGVPSIVMTLWAVEDRSGAQIMEGFYENLSRGQSKSEALRSSKLAYLSSADRLHAHPYFWAAYVTIGEDAPLYKKEGRDLAWIIALSLSAVGLLVLYLLRRRRRIISSGS